MSSEDVLTTYRSCEQTDMNVQSNIYSNQHIDRKRILQRF